LSEPSSHAGAHELEQYLADPEEPDINVNVLDWCGGR